MPKPEQAVHIQVGDIVELSLKREKMVRDSYLELADVDPFMAEMGAMGLISIQQSILRLEFYLKYNSSNEVSNTTLLDRYKQEHKEYYEQLRAKIPNFEQVYDKVLVAENQCARENLDDNDGKLFAFVVPKFNPDGTHEPTGERDVPWNRKTG